MIRACAVIDAGIVDYQTGLTLQLEARRKVSEGLVDGVLLLVEHSPVITIGRGGGADNLRTAKDILLAQNIDIIDTDRGGNITCHNPGQLVAYPILNLRRWREDVHWFVHALEEALIRTLGHYGITAGRKMRYTGIWVGNQKIAAIGISVKRWITGHGLALNVCNDISLFSQIVPCGIQQFGITSLSGIGCNAGIDNVKQTFVTEFCCLFACEQNDRTRVKGMDS